MEALTAVQIGLLTIYDMRKAVDRGMVMGDIRVLESMVASRVTGAPLSPSNFRRIRRIRVTGQGAASAGQARPPVDVGLIALSV